SGRDPVRAEARARPAESAVDLRRRPHADSGEGTDADGRYLTLAAAARDAALLPPGSALRHGPARLRAGVAAALGGAERRAHDRGPRQGQQGAAGPAERRVAAGNG